MRYYGGYNVINWQDRIYSNTSLEQIILNHPPNSSNSPSSSSTSSGSIIIVDKPYDLPTMPSTSNAKESLVFTHTNKHTHTHIYYYYYYYYYY
jgi:hypothetical protein